VAEKFPTKTKPAIAKNALAVSSLALRVLMQVDEMLQPRGEVKAYRFPRAAYTKQPCQRLHLIKTNI
jgi:hypothetical protein